MTGANGGNGDGATASGGGRLADRAYHAAAAAYRSTHDGWERGVHAALNEVFGVLAEDPEQTGECPALTAPSTEAMTERTRLVERFVALLEPGAHADDVAHADVVAEAVGESVIELIGRYVAEERLGELRDAVPTATLLVLTPFVGADTAEAVAASDDRVR